MPNGKISVYIFSPLHLLLYRATALRPSRRVRRRFGAAQPCRLIIAFQHFATITRDVIGSYAENIWDFFDIFIEFPALRLHFAAHAPYIFIFSTRFIAGISHAICTRMMLPSRGKIWRQHDTGEYIFPAFLSMMPFDTRRMRCHATTTVAASRRR